MPESNEAKTFDPLFIIGLFWTIFGVFVLAGIFFVEETAYVPLVRGQVTNVIASFLLLSIGIGCLIKSRRKKTS